MCEFYKNFIFFLKKTFTPLLKLCNVSLGGWGEGHFEHSCRRRLSYINDRRRTGVKLKANVFVNYLKFSLDKKPAAQWRKSNDTRKREVFILENVTRQKRLVEKNVYANKYDVGSTRYSSPHSIYAHFTKLQKYFILFLYVQKVIDGR